MVQISELFLNQYNLFNYPFQNNKHSLTLEGAGTINLLLHSWNISKLCIIRVNNNLYPPILHHEKKSTNESSSSLVRLGNTFNYFGNLYNHHEHEPQLQLITCPEWKIKKCLVSASESRIGLVTLNERRRCRYDRKRCENIAKLTL